MLPIFQQYTVYELITKLPSYYRKIIYTSNGIDKCILYIQGQLTFRRKDAIATQHLGQYKHGHRLEFFLYFHGKLLENSENDYTIKSTMYYF